jgi:CPA2 family monovalent cation:H+ antiporter-2
MSADPLFFRDLAMVLVAAVLGGTLAWLARQPLVLGYVVGGIAISPFTPGPAISGPHRLEVFAEVGVVLLMFSIGVEFSLKDLLRVKWVAFGGGPLGIALSIGLAVVVGLPLGWPVQQGLIIGIVTSVASTMVLGRLLLDRGELHTRHGRVLIGISLIEDLAVVVMLALMPALGALGADRALAVGHGLAIAALVLVPFLALAARVVPALLARVARTRDQELFLLVALAVGLGTAAFTQAVGLSLALGAFLAGLLISESDYAHETLARLLPLRDTFGAFFFVTVGALIDPVRVLDHLPLLASVVGLVVVGKLVIRTAVVWLVGETLWTAVLTGVGLAQIGEFSFVLVQAARQAGQIGDDVYQVTLAASLLTIVINAALFRVAPRYLGSLRLAGRSIPEGPPANALERHVVLCGYGRVGSAVAEALDTFRIPWVAIDNNPDVVRSLRARGVPALFGDASHRGLLEAAGADRAVLAVVALPEMDRARLAVGRLRQIRAGLPILARTHDRAEHERLRQAGATEVIQPELEAGATLIRHALNRLHQPRERVLAYLEQYRDAINLGAPRPEPADRLPEIHEVTLDGGALSDRSLREARVRERFGVSVLAITRADGAVVANPSADTLLRVGDRLRLFGLPEQVNALLSYSAHGD